MALLDVLQERTARRCRTAQVSCGELGLLTVEALPPQELERLQTDRAVLYAACRELQKAGDTLRRAGKIFAPDEITAYLSDEEAASGAAAVRDISGAAASGTSAVPTADTTSGAEDGSTSRTENGEIRLDTVQAENNVYSESRHARKTGSPRVRPDSVQAEGKILTSVGHDFPEIRLSSVQEEAEVPLPDSGAKSLKTGHGQDSREFSGRGAVSRKTDKKSRDIVDLPGEGTPNLGQTLVRSEGSEAAAAHEIKSEILEKLHETASEPGNLEGTAMHETTSDFQDGLHEITSEQSGSGSARPHEIKSEFREALHETESESGGTMAETLHEMTSESPARGPGRMHETGSEIPEEMHETTSESGAPAQERVHEIRSEVREAVHEMESELTDRVARSILEGLRRAAAVR